jgi:hypothetical protein
MNYFSHFLQANWIKSNGFAGAFVWTLDFDDFNGKCPHANGRRYPLIGTIARELSGVRISDSAGVRMPPTIFGEKVLFSSLSWWFIDQRHQLSKMSQNVEKLITK